MTNLYGELLDVKEIVVSHAGNSSNNDARIEVIVTPPVNGGSNPTVNLFTSLRLFLVVGVSSSLRLLLPVRIIIESGRLVSIMVGLTVKSIRLT